MAGRNLFFLFTVVVRATNGSLGGVLWNALRGLSFLSDLSYDGIIYVYEYDVLIFLGFNMYGGSVFLRVFLSSFFVFFFCSLSLDMCFSVYSRFVPFSPANNTWCYCI